MGRVRSRSETTSGKRPAPARSNRTGTGERGGKPDARLPLAAASKRRNGLPRSGTGRGRREAGDEDGAAGDEDGHSPRAKARAYRAKKLAAAEGWWAAAAVSATRSETEAVETDLGGGLD